MAFVFDMHTVSPSLQAAAGSGSSKKAPVAIPFSHYPSFFPARKTDSFMMSLYWNAFQGPRTVESFHLLKHFSESLEISLWVPWHYFTGYLIKPLVASLYRNRLLMHIVLWFFGAASFIRIIYFSIHLRTSQDLSKNRQEMKAGLALCPQRACSGEALPEETSSQNHHHPLNHFPTLVCIYLIVFPSPPLLIKAPPFFLSLFVSSVSTVLLPRTQSINCLPLIQQSFSFTYFSSAQYNSYWACQPVSITRASQVRTFSGMSLNFLSSLPFWMHSQHERVTRCERVWARPHVWLIYLF